MPRKRALAFLAAAGMALAAGVAALIPVTTSHADAACATAYDDNAVYNGGAVVSYNSHNWTAKWWTQHEVPSTGGSGVWGDGGPCGGSGGGGGGGTQSCSYPSWVAGQWYDAGAIVKYTNGLYYQATNANPGYDPTISTWYWSPYTYTGLVSVLSKFPSFASTGSDTVKKQEAAAFLANVSHETGGLVYIDEQNTAVWGTYCDTSQPYGCPAGKEAYHGRGPIQLSWNFNYKAAGDALGVDLLNHPEKVGTDSAISWQTGVWYWMTGTGGAGTTSHNAMVNGQGFGTTIRAINSIECNGGHPDEMNHRVSLYQQYAGILGVPTGGNLTC
jgi:predicted chitinase